MMQQQVVSFSLFRRQRIPSIRFHSFANFPVPVPQTLLGNDAVLNQDDMDGRHTSFIAIRVSVRPVATTTTTTTTIVTESSSMQRLSRKMQRILQSDHIVRAAGSSCRYWYRYRNFHRDRRNLLHEPMQKGTQCKTHKRREPERFGLWRYHYERNRIEPKSLSTSFERRQDKLYMGDCQRGFGRGDSCQWKRIGRQTPRYHAQETMIQENGVFLLRRLCFFEIYGCIPMVRTHALIAIGCKQNEKSSTITTTILFLV